MTDEEIARVNRSFDRYEVVWRRDVDRVLAEYRRVRKLTYKRNRRKRAECIDALLSLHAIGHAFLEKRQAAMRHPP